MSKLKRYYKFDVELILTNKEDGSKNIITHKGVSLLNDNDFNLKLGDVYCTKDVGGKDGN